MPITPTKFEQGFTLIEAVIVIVITGILAGVVAVFIRAPVEGYFDSARRAALTDIADIATRRMSRDLHLALPNSIRTPSPLCLEFLPTSSGGRYRADLPGNALDFSSATTTFDVLGNLSPVPVANDQLVVYNLGIPGADAYSGVNRATIASASASSVTLAAATLFPLASPGNRFLIVPAAEQAVFYACSNPGIDAAGNGTGTLFRFSSYGINAAMPTACPVPQANTPMLAQRLSACAFSYAPNVSARNGLVSLRLSVTEANETVSLYQDIHVNNVP